MEYTGHIKIVAKMPVAPENVEKFVALASELIEASRKEEGNICYSLNADKKDPNTLVFTECWKDKEAIRFHNHTEHFTRILPQLKDLCCADPSSELYLELK